MQLDARFVDGTKETPTTVAEMALDRVGMCESEIAELRGDLRKLTKFVAVLAKRAQNDAQRHVQTT